MTPSIVFLSDFGYRNEWVGICHAVMDRIAPGTPIIDLSHGIPPLDVRAGALLLADSLQYIGDDAIGLAVVDPSVGRDCDLAVRTGSGRLLVGPDNGILHPAWKALGGAAQAVLVTSEKYTLRPVAPSFHARDVLAPPQPTWRTVWRSKTLANRSTPRRWRGSAYPSRTSNADGSSARSST